MTFARPVPPNNYDLPDKTESAFWLMAQARVDFVVEAFPVGHPEYGTMLVIGTEIGAIYITKEQAMKFFNLEEKK